MRQSDVRAAAGLPVCRIVFRACRREVKPVKAASLALRSDGSYFVPLDDCVETLRETGLDMSEKYKETSTGGLAVNVMEC